jgi:hypothetical protein
MDDPVRIVACDPAMRDALREQGLGTEVIDAADDDHRRLGPLEDLMIARWRGATHVVVGPSPDSPTAHHSVRRYLREHGAYVADRFGGALWQIPAPPAPGDPAVFCLGLSKTATTSLAEALDVLGVPCLHWGGQQPWRAVTDAFRAGELLTSRLPQGYGGYADIGSLLSRYRLVDLQYPGSRFILTVRDEDAWVDSKRRHVERNQRGHASGHYQGKNLEIDEQAWRESWRGHLAAVREYFGERADFLELDLTVRPRWDELASFLDVPAPNINFPAANINGRPSTSKSSPSKRFLRRASPR